MRNVEVRALTFNLPSFQIPQHTHTQLTVLCGSFLPCHNIWSACLDVAVCVNQCVCGMRNVQQPNSRVRSIHSTFRSTYSTFRSTHSTSRSINFVDGILCVFFVAPSLSHCNISFACVFVALAPSHSQRGSVWVLCCPPNWSAG